MFLFESSHPYGVQVTYYTESILLFADDVSVSIDSKVLLEHAERVPGIFQYL
jgi:hypothetical protein